MRMIERTIEPFERDDPAFRFGPGARREGAVQRDELGEVVEVLPLSFERGCCAGIIGLRRCRIEMPKHCDCQTSGERNEDKNRRSNPERGTDKNALHASTPDV